MSSPSVHGPSVQGRCACGLVRFEGDLPPRFVAHCHCENCRRAHGAGFVTWAGFGAGRFRWLAGEERVTAHRTATGATRRFCSVCGSPLTYESPRWAGEVHVAVAHLEEELPELPKAHVYADRAPQWCPVTDALPRLGGPDGTAPLPAGPAR